MFKINVGVLIVVMILTAQLQLDAQTNDETGLVTIELGKDRFAAGQDITVTNSVAGDLLAAKAETPESATSPYRGEVVPYYPANLAATTTPAPPAEGEAPAAPESAPGPKSTPAAKAVPAPRTPPGGPETPGTAKALQSPPAGSGGAGR